MPASRTVSTASPEDQAKSAPAALSKTTPKDAKLSKLIKLKLSSYLLTRFPYEDLEKKPAKSKGSRRQPSETPKTSKNTSDVKDEGEADTPIPPAAVDDEGEGETPKENKRKGIPGPKPGSKRSAPPPTTEADGTPKPKGKPGPKKRKVEGENGAPGPAPGPKLGPKANQGAINAQLRALDRTGKPCRRWGKRTVLLKSFTGINWDLPYWQTPKLKRINLSDDVQSQDASSSDAKNDPTSSQVASESNTGQPNGTAPNGTPDLKGAPSFPNEAPSASSDNAAEVRETAPQEPIESTA